MELMALADEIKQRGAVVVGTEMAERHATAHGEACLCAVAALADLLRMAAQPTTGQVKITLGPTKLRAGP